MKILAKIWQKFKSEPDIWFFYGFLLTFTLSVRKIIYFYPINGNFNEYSAISLYLSDIFLILTLFFWIISILYNKYILLSIFKSPIHSLSLKKLWTNCWEWLKCSTWNILKRKLILIPLLLVIWAFLSMAWSDNKIITFYRSIKLFEFYLLYIYIIYKCSTWNILKHTFWIIIFLGLFQSIIGIWQFIIQKSLGLFWLKESLISPEILGVAKIVFGSEAYIRSYGLLSHPNVLGGFLLISITLTLLYRKLFHACPVKSNCSTWNILKERMLRIVPRGTFLWLILAIQIIAIILTFSKSALIGLFIALIYVFINQYKNVPRGTFGDTTVAIADAKIFHACPVECSTWNISSGVEHFKRYFVFSLLIFGLLLFYFKVDLYSLFIKSIEERFLYLAISIKAIVSNIFLGLGNGQFVLEMQKYASQSLEFWQFQPVHNVFLLILSELGLVGLFLFIWFILELFHACPKQKCSTWNISGRVEHFDSGRHSDPALAGEESQDKAMKSFANAQDDSIGESILYNNNTILSSSIILTYFKAILLGFIFIMLFDHYLWDIQQGQMILWMVIGVIAGLTSSYEKNQKK